MNGENEATSTRIDAPDEWKTVAECAALLGLSERQARRYAGRLAGHDRREAGHNAGHEAGHGATLVRVSAVRDLRKKAASRAARPDTAPDVTPDTLTPEAGHISATPDMRPDSQNDVSGARVLAETEAAFLREALQAERENSQRDREQIAFLRAQVEAANRQAAESAAALREYLKLSAKQLSGDGMGQVGTKNVGAQDGLAAAKSSAEGNQSGAQKNAAQSAPRREARPLWKVILGLR